MLLDWADLVVLDLSGFTPDNLGVRYELQRVIDKVPIERVILLADRRSDRNFRVPRYTTHGSRWRPGRPTRDGSQGSPGSR